MPATFTKSRNREARINGLAALLEIAQRTAIESDPGPDADMGTCNLDSPAFRVKGMTANDIRTAAVKADVNVMEFNWMRERWWMLCITLRGQGQRRTIMMEAAQRELNRAAADGAIDGLDACGYYQID